MMPETWKPLAEGQEIKFDTQLDVVCDRPWTNVEGMVVLGADYMSMALCPRPFDGYVVVVQSGYHHGIDVDYMERVVYPAELTDAGLAILTRELELAGVRYVPEADENQVEAMARAIYASDGGGDDSRWPGPTAETYRRRARAAREAIR